MKILFDQGVPVPLAGHLSKHFVETAFSRGWHALRNGELLDAAEREGFEAFITTDQSLKHQQNLQSRTVAVIVLMSTSWPQIQLRAADVAAAVDGAQPGNYIEVPI
jgi:predicted nuclease of predicted toxin-antitoxin system